MHLECPSYGAVYSTAVTAPGDQRLVHDLSLNPKISSIHETSATLLCVTGRRMTLVKCPDTRKSLLVRLADPTQGQAWEEFVAIYEPLIYRLARAKGLQHADAQDMTQEVFSVVGKAIDRFDPDSLQGSFRAWLSQITRNLVINSLTRDRQTRGTGDTNMQLLLQEQPACDEETATWYEVERRREIFRWAAKNVREQFEETTWRAFWLTGVEGETIEDVARVLGKSQGAVRIARCRVLAKLKDEVGRFECPGDS